MSEPAWLREARANLGVAEIPGAKSNPKILEWARRLGGRILGAGYTNDDTAWCGLFAAHCVSSAGIAPPPIALRAKAWATWGEPIAPCVGAVLVFQREGGGHVGFCVGESLTAWRVLGGNQSNRVCETWIEKARCIAVRWPPGAPRTAAPLVLTQAGVLSRNEA